MKPKKGPGKKSTAVRTGAELRRLEECGSGKVPWKRWGPYLSERQWGTVREDYSADGDVWGYFSHDMARSRAYRWGEDGIGGISDDEQRLCFSVALWNGSDPILKERLFGLTNAEGNHGEDVKEIYYYLDNTPTHSYMKMLYKYPQGEFPYTRLLEESRRRTRNDPEFELLDTGLFDGDRYFDVFIEYAKGGPEDILIRITAHNRGPNAAPLHLLPQLWFRNTWSWGRNGYTPGLTQPEGRRVVRIDHKDIGIGWLYADGNPELLFCENESNLARLHVPGSPRGWFKDAFHEYVVHGVHAAVNADRKGTKAGIWYSAVMGPGESTEVRLRLCPEEMEKPFDGFERAFASRIVEADEFHHKLEEGIAGAEAQAVHRQAIAGMLWSKQYYAYDVSQWLAGDPAQPPPPAQRLRGRNCGWIHLSNANVLSMPDTWEFPWYAAWDLAFHCVALAGTDPAFAKEQLLLLTREWYMHPNGQLPAYEWELGEVNPPVHAWAAWRVYTIDRRLQRGAGDRKFLERIFHKLLLNFTWWVNRKDAEGRNIFQGGFLGLDNIGVVDRNMKIPGGGQIEQADGTSWMAMFSLNMMRIAVELSMENPSYQDMATKFFDHFLFIAGAMVNIGGKGISLWDEGDEFFYDVIHREGGASMPLKVRSMVGLIPLFAVETLDADVLENLPEFKRHVETFLEYRPDLAGLISRWHVQGVGERKLLSLLRGHRMKCLLRRMLDEKEFLSPYGVRALSRFHADHPFTYTSDGVSSTVRYEPGESTSGLFGGNSNWRGPVWFPLNFLIIESLQRFHHYYGDDFRIECPTGSGMFLTLNQVAQEISRRLTRLFLRNPDGIRPADGKNEKLRKDPHFGKYVTFSEYFHGDTGAGLGASHQTGWTGLVAKLLQPRRK